EPTEWNYCLRVRIPSFKTFKPGEPTMVAAFSCPGPDFLQRLVAGDSSETEAPGIEEHLAGCSRCQSTLRVLNLDESLVKAARRTANVAEILAERLDDVLLARLHSLNQSEKRGSGATPSVVMNWTGGETQTCLPAEEVRNLLAPPETPGEIGRLGEYRVLGLLGAG